MSRCLAEWNLRSWKRRKGTIFFMFGLPYGKYQDTIKIVASSKQQMTPKALVHLQDWVFLVVCAEGPMEDAKGLGR